MRQLLHLLILILIVLPAHSKPATLVLEYKELYRAFERIGVIEGQRFARTRLRVEGPPITRAKGAVELTIKALERDIPLQVARDGSFDAPFSTALRDENPQIWTNLPADDDRVGFVASLYMEAPGQREFSYRLIGEMRAELSQLLKQRGFMSRLFSPAVRGVRVHFEGKARNVAIVATREGDVQFTSEADGSIDLPISDGWISAQYPVRLSAMPSKIELVLDR